MWPPSPGETFAPARWRPLLQGSRAPLLQCSTDPGLLQGSTRGAVPTGPGRAARNSPGLPGVRPPGAAAAGLWGAEQLVLRRVQRRQYGAPQHPAAAHHSRAHPRPQR